MRNVMTSMTSFAPSNEPIRVGFLLRVSTSKQVDKVSLQEQEAACERKRAELSNELGRSMVLVAVYRDAGVACRDALRAALTDISTEKIQYLIAYELDRLTREPAQAGAVLRTCVNAGARVHFYKNDVWYNEEMGDLLPSDEIGNTRRVDVAPIRSGSTRSTRRSPPLQRKSSSELHAENH